MLFYPQWTRLCRVCGKQFTPPDRRVHLCSDECREERDRQNKIKEARQHRERKRLARQLITRVCEICGKQFHRSDNRFRKTCSVECRAEIQRRTKLRNHRKWATNAYQDRNELAMLALATAQPQASRLCNRCHASPVLGSRKYCDPCKLAIQAEHNRNNQAKMRSARRTTLAPRFCIVCQVVFDPNHRPGKAKLTCSSDCAKEHRRRHNNKPREAT